MQTVYAAVYVQRDLSIMFFSSTTKISWSSKLLTFHSLRMHHIKHKDVILQTSKMLWLSIWLLQLAINSITFLRMIHSTPRRRKIETHNFLATSQGRKI